MTGYIWMFNQPKGWGFVKDGEGREWFFHISNTKFVPVLGARVEFELAAPLKLGQKEQAINVRLEGAL